MWDFPRENARFSGYMGDLRRENVCFSLKWGICEEKTRNIHLNGGCSKRKRDFHLNVVFLKRKRVIFTSMGFLEEKLRVSRINGGFSKRKRVIFA